MVLVETPHSVVRVNQSKFRLDGDPWHSIQVPLQDDPAGNQATPPQQAQLVDHSGNEPLPRPGMDHSLWIKQANNQVQLLEAMVQEPLLSPHMNKQGFLVGVPFTLEAVHETTQWADLAYLTVSTNKTSMATAISYALDQHDQGRKFIFEVPYDLIRWESQQVKALPGKSGIHWNTCDQRQYGANRRKLTCLIFNMEPKMLAPLFTKCDNKATGSKEKTTAQPFLGRWPRYRQLLAMLLATEVNPGDQPALTVEDGSFLTDVLELGLEEMAAPAARLCSLADFQSLLTWTLKAKQQNTGIGLPWPAAFEATTEPMKPHLFKDAPVAKLIKATDQLPPGMELCLHLDRSETVAAGEVPEAKVPTIPTLHRMLHSTWHLWTSDFLAAFGRTFSCVHVETQQLDKSIVHLQCSSSVISARHFLNTRVVCCYVLG